MKMSQQTSELFKALSKFQGELCNANKNVNKTGITYKYADLAECINTAKPVLADNGLAVVQMMGNTEAGQTMITMLTHSSGEFISSETVMPNATLQGQAGKNPAQVLGSAITYMRRYCFAAIIGMAQEDDDAQANTHQGKSQPRQQPQKKPLEFSDELGGWVMDELNKGATHQQVIAKLEADWFVSQEVKNNVLNIGV